VLLQFHFVVALRCTKQNTSTINTTSKSAESGASPQTPTPTSNTKPFSTRMEQRPIIVRAGLDVWPQMASAPVYTRYVDSLAPRPRSVTKQLPRVRMLFVRQVAGPCRKQSGWIRIVAPLTARNTGRSRAKCSTVRSSVWCICRRATRWRSNVIPVNGPGQTCLVHSPRCSR
jgi:hypothetical protein